MSTTMTAKFLKALANELPDDCQVFLSNGDNSSPVPVYAFGFGIVEPSKDGAVDVKMVDEDAPLFNAVILLPSPMRPQPHKPSETQSCYVH